MTLCNIKEPLILLLYCTNHEATVATSKVGVVKVSVGVVSAGSSSLASESGDSLRDSISDSCATYFVNSSKLTLPSSSACGWGKWVWSVGGV